MGGADPDVAREVAAALEKIRRLLRASILDQARSMPGSITAPQLAALEALVDELRASSRGLTLSELSTRMGLSHSTVSGIVDRLEARGFLRRAPRDDDRRFVEVQLTDAVQRWLRHELPARRADPIERALAHASPRERATVRRGVAALLRLLEESRSPEGAE